MRPRSVSVLASVLVALVVVEPVAARSVSSSPGRGVTDRPQRGQEPAPARGACVGRTTNNGSVSVERNDDGSTFRWKLGRCSATVRMEGEVELTPDFRGFAGLSGRGLVRIEASDGEGDRSLEVRPGRSGLDYAYRLDGRSAVFGEEGRTWLGGFLVDLYRVTGYAAKERAGWMLTEQGPQAVLAEVDLLRSDRSRHAYLGFLADSRGVEATRVLSAAGAIGSDHEMAEFLLELLEAWAVDPATEGAWLEALDTIESSHEYGRVAQALMRRTVRRRL